MGNNDQTVICWYSSNYFHQLKCKINQKCLKLQSSFYCCLRSHWADFPSLPVWESETNSTMGSHTAINSWQGILSCILLPKKSFYCCLCPYWNFPPTFYLLWTQRYQLDRKWGKISPRKCWTTIKNLIGVLAPSPLYAKKKPKTFWLEVQFN